MYCWCFRTKENVNITSDQKELLFYHVRMGIIMHQLCEVMNAQAAKEPNGI